MVDIPFSENPRGRELIVALGCLLALDVIFVGFRLFARYKNRATFALNDYMIVTSLIFLITLFGIEIGLVRNGGAGLPVMVIVENWGGWPTVTLAGKLLFTANVVWNLSMLAFKVSILHFYIEVFGRTSPRFRLTAWIMIGICVASTIALLFEIFFLCRPLPLFWDKTITHGSCGSLIVAYTVPGVINTALDFIIFALPLRIVWNLCMPIKKKIATTLVFTIGLGICVIACVRLKYVITLDQNNFTYSIWHFALLGTMEPMLGVISACLPMMPSAFTHLTNRRLLTWTDRSQVGNGGDKSGNKSTLSGTNSTAEKTFKVGSDRSSEDNFLLHEVSTHKTGLQGGIKVTTDYSVESHPIHDDSRV